VLGDDEAEHGVAKELQSFVRQCARRLCDVGPVRECLLEEALIGKVVSEPLLQRRGRGRLLVGSGVGSGRVADRTPCGTQAASSLAVT
jgi:hypothetical protein